MKLHLKSKTFESQPLLRKSDFNYFRTTLYNIGHSTTVTGHKLTEILHEHEITKDGKYEIRTYKLQTINNISAKWKLTISKSFSVLEDNSLIEIIHLIVHEFSEFMSKHFYTFSYSYDREYGSIQFFFSK